MKKERQERTIPLYPALQAMDLTSWPPYPTSAKASKAFTSHRRATFGPDDGTRRRAIINMHSARRWTITALERNGVDERVIADIVGHDRKSMTGRYSSGSSVEAMRNAVESLKLPTP
jgi:integrase